MFLGEYEYRIDQKGRVAIPAKLREAFRGGIVFSRGFDDCITAYPTAEWQRVADRLAALPLTRGNARRVNRFVFSGAFSLELDRLGRVILPLALRQYAQIKDEVVIAGVGSHIEIWSKELWAQEQSLMSEQAGEIAEATEIIP